MTCSTELMSPPPPPGGGVPPPSPPPPASLPPPPRPRHPLAAMTAPVVPAIFRKSLRFTPMVRFPYRANVTLKQQSGTRIPLVSRRVLLTKWQTLTSERVPCKHLARDSSGSRAASHF